MFVQGLEYYHGDRLNNNTSGSISTSSTSSTSSTNTSLLASFGEGGT